MVYEWLNEQSIFPSPIGVNPLEKGTTSAYLAPGEDGLMIAKSLAEGDQIVLTNESGDEPIEKVELKSIETDHEHLLVHFTQPIQKETWDFGTRAYKLIRSFRLFGYNAPPRYSDVELDDSTKAVKLWKFFNVEFSVESTEELRLDSRYDDLKVGTRLLLVEGKGTNQLDGTTQQKLLTVMAVDQVEDQLGALSDTVTRIQVSPNFSAITDRRHVVIYELAGPLISFWGFSYPDSIDSSTVYIPGHRIDAETIEIARAIEKYSYKTGNIVKLTDIDIDRQTILKDKNDKPIAAAINRVNIIKEANQDYLKIELSIDGSITLDRTSAVLMGNIALASHGETVSSEVIGDADPAIPFQEFTLKKSPVTFVPSSGQSGVDNTLQLFVNDMLWKAVDSLYGKGPKDMVYTARINNDAEMSVRFGDGVTGARPPKGRANVVARYRQGLGLEGRIKAGTLKTLLDKPKGMKSVINPAGAEGGADPEALDSARKNAPATVRTFNRAVSLLDIEDLAQSRSEVAKARVTWVWSGQSQAAHLTIAGQKGGSFSSSALARIHCSLTAQRDPNRQLLLDNYKAIPIVVKATLNVAETYVAAKVADAARSALLRALSFEILEFAQSIHLSDVYAILQNVSGVIAVDIDLFMFKQKADVSNVEFDDFLNARGIRRLSDGTPKPVQNHLWIFPAQPTKVSNIPTVLPAEQAFIESPSQDVTIITKGGLSD
jgi:hypothetical protein